MFQQNQGQISLTQLMYQPGRFDHTNLPRLIININTIDDSQKFLRDILCTVLNIINEKAMTSPIRIMLFNMTAAYRFECREIGDIVQLAHNKFLLALASGQPKTVDTLSRNCEEAIVLYSSSLLINNTQIANQFPANIISAAQSNVAALQTINAQFNQLAYNRGQNFGGQQIPGQFNSGFNSGLGGVISQPIQQSPFVSGSMFTTSNTLMNQQVTTPQEEGHYFKPTIQQSMLPVETVIESVTKPVIELSTTIPKTDEVKSIRQGVMMDRNSHRMIGYGFEVDTEARNTAVVGNIDRLEDAALINEFNALDSSEVEYPLDECARSGVGMYDNIDSMIYDTVLEWTGKEKTVKVFRTFSCIGLPFYYNRRTEKDPIIKPLTFNNMSYKELARHIRLMQSNALDNRPSSGVCTYEMVFWGKVDKFFTNIINKYLRINMQLPKVNITSFAADYMELLNGIEARYGVNSGSILEKRFTELPKNVIECELHLYDDLVPSIDKTKEYGQKAVFIPYGAEVTCVELLDDELDFDMVAGESKLIKRSENNALYRIIASGYKHSSDINLNVLVRYIITQDDVRYEVTTTSASKDDYFITKL